LERLRNKGAVLVQRSEPTLWAPVPHRDLMARLRQEGEREPLAVVVGDGVETILADFGRDRPEGMWTHHPAVALLAVEHLAALG
jgi:hypothetical protein